MWNQKLPKELSAERRNTIIRALYCTVLLWAAICYALVHLTDTLNLPLGDLSQGLIAAALALASVWIYQWRSNRALHTTLVCDRCNCLKCSDGQARCRCGGKYRSLAEMKWIDRRMTDNFQARI